nr:leucyl/phenylalanyl-tRNA--protein transferase [Planctomycetota bacterium]
MDEPFSVNDADGYPVTPELVLEAYWQRCFPMADHRRGRLRWYRPETRAVITWDRWKVPESLRKRLKSDPFTISVD